MGHVIIHKTFSGDKTPQQITDAVLYAVQHSGDRYGTERVQFPCSGIIFENEDAAKAYINSINHDFYGGYAVKFRDYSHVPYPQKALEYRKKREETMQKKKEYADAHSVKRQKAAYVGCSACGSKLNRERLRGELCPLCNTDLRAKTTMERIKAYDQKIAELDVKAEREHEKDKKKAKIMWLVKYEYHC